MDLEKIEQSADFLKGILDKLSKSKDATCYVTSNDTEYLTKALWALEKARDLKTLLINLE